MVQDFYQTLSKKFAIYLNVTKINTSSYHPQMDGLVEKSQFHTDQHDLKVL